MPVLPGVTIIRLLLGFIMLAHHHPPLPVLLSVLPVIMITRPLLGSIMLIATLRALKAPIQLRDALVILMHLAPLPVVPFMRQAPMLVELVSWCALDCSG